MPYPRPKASRRPVASRPTTPDFIENGLATVQSMRSRASGRIYELGVALERCGNLIVAVVLAVLAEAYFLFKISVQLNRMPGRPNAE